uniref:Uncharacterized protein n=1 Tax=Moniliophthora roreri TaxID=221103 RepID=A0A0W0FQR9_MONRR
MFNTSQDGVTMTYAHNNRHPKSRHKYSRTMIRSSFPDETILPAYLHLRRLKPPEQEDLTAVPSPPSEFGTAGDCHVIISSLGPVETLKENDDS